MVVLALVLLIIVVVFSVAIVLSNPEVYPLSLFRVLVPVTSAGVFFTGFGAALVTVIAVLLLRTGIARRRAQRVRLRTAEQAAINAASRRDPDEVPARNHAGDPAHSPLPAPSGDDPERVDLDPAADPDPVGAPDREPADPDRDEPRV